MTGRIVFTLDKTGKYSWICQAVETISGYTQKELIGTSAFDYIHPEDKLPIIDTFTDPLTYEVYKERQFRVIDKDGTIVKISSRTIRLPDGTVLGVFDRRINDRGNY